MIRRRFDQGSRLDKNRCCNLALLHWKVSYPIDRCKRFGPCSWYVILRKKTKNGKRMRRARCASIGEEELFVKPASLLSSAGAGFGCRKGKRVPADIDSLNSSLCPLCLHRRLQLRHLFLESHHINEQEGDWLFCIEIYSPKTMLILIYSMLELEQIDERSMCDWKMEDGRWKMRDWWLMIDNW